VVYLAVLACVSRATTKKVINFLRKKCTPEKILATPMYTSDLLTVAMSSPVRHFAVLTVHGTAGS